MQSIRSNKSAITRIRESVERSRRIAHLRDREASLITICTEAPRQLDRIREELAQLEVRQ